jgi:4-amino-4-deoxy-L-arabinose transferase
MWGASGLAFLTKGPPGLLPLAAILLFIAASEGARPLGRAITVQGLLLFLGLGAGWFAVVVAQRPELLPFYLDGEVAARVATARFHRNPEWYGPLVVYLPALVAGTLPWTGAVVAAVAGGVRELRLRGWTWWRDDPQRLFLVLWFWLPLAVFSAARSRLHLYMVPLCVPLALVAARSLATTARGGWQELRFFTVRPVGARPPP